MGLQKAYEFATVNGDYDKIRDQTSPTVVNLDAATVVTSVLSNSPVELAKVDDLRPSPASSATTLSAAGSGSPTGGSSGGVGGVGGGNGGGRLQHAFCPPMLFVRVAAFLGAAAVTLGAYGTHVSKPVGDLAIVFHTANLYHFLHTLLLFTVAFSRYPRLTGSLITVGIIVFSGTCYMHAFTGNVYWVQATPYGGMLLIAAWTSYLV